MKKTSSWSPEDASRSQWTPSTPRTFAISCGSATTVVVPSGSTSRANSSTMSFTDSRCMCASMKPGDDVLPGRVEDLGALVVAEPRDDAVHDRDVRLQPLPREDREHAPAPDDEIGWLVTARYGNPAPEIRHGPSVLRRARPGPLIAASAPRPMLCAVL